MAAPARKESQKRLYHLGRVLQTVFEGFLITAAENCSQRLILVCRAAKSYAKRDSTCLDSSIKRNWVFKEKDDQYSLFLLSSMPIRRYIKIKAEANPYDVLWKKYFERCKFRRSISALDAKF